MSAHSLQTPNDIKVNPFKPSSGTPPLNQEELSAALPVKYNKVFPEVERRYADPVDNGQRFVLISFVPSKGATPDTDGVYGMAKIRGAYGTIEEADDRAEFLVKNVDSYQQILTTFMGRPFPLVVSGEDYGATIKEIDVNKKVEEVVKEDVKEKRNEEKKVMKEIKKKEEELKKDVEQEITEESNPEELYTMLRVKRSQLLYTYIESKKKMEEMKTLILQSDQQIKKMDAQHPDFINMYKERYTEAREAAGLTNLENDESFIKYMDTNLDLETIFYKE